MTMLTQAEVAVMLRKSVSTIKRLRLSGDLPFLPGKPVLIRQEDVNAYIERSVRCQSQIEGRISMSTGQGSMRSGGQKAADLKAARRAHEIFSKLKKSSPIS